MSSRVVFINNYFKRFPQFCYHRSHETMCQFNRLANEMEWSKDERRKELLALRTAMVMQFNTTYGVDETDLQGWERLCRAIDAKPVPTTVEECTKLFKRTNVNLWDLVDAHRTRDGVAKTYRTRSALAEYTKDSGKYFSRQDAKAGGLLKYLLRKID